MAKRLSKKQRLDLAKKQVKSLNRTRARQNKAFATLKPAEKRVAIAQDVLAQLTLKRFNAVAGIWLADSNDGEALLGPDQAKAKKADELQDVLAGIKECDGCALGGMFMCAVEKADKLKVNQLLDFKGEDDSEESDDEENVYGDGVEGGEDDGESLQVVGEDALNYLGKFFSRAQLELIESAFEQGGGAYGTEGEFFCEGIDDAGTRLRLIMENIVVNKGTFKPYGTKNAPIQEWRTPGYFG